MLRTGHDFTDARCSLIRNAKLMLLFHAMSNSFVISYAIRKLHYARPCRYE